MNDDRNKLTHFAAPTLFDLNETVVTSSRPPLPREQMAPKRSCSEACLTSDHIYTAHQSPPTTDGAHLLDCVTSSRPPPPREPIAPKRSCSKACLTSPSATNHIYAAHQSPPTTDSAHLHNCVMSSRPPPPREPMFDINFTVVSQSY